MPAEIGPLALIDRTQGRLTLAAVDAAAEGGGLVPGQPLATARALMPGLRTAPHDPAGDVRALARLAAWCGRYTPWAALDGCGCDGAGAAGILLDVTGCGHLFGADRSGIPPNDLGGDPCGGDRSGTPPGDPLGGGPFDGEAALLADLVGRLAGLGFSARAVLAETAGGAWALARFAEAPPETSPEAPVLWFGKGRCAVVPPGRLRAALAPLPPAALRLPPATVELLTRLGLRRIGDLFVLPPAALAPRFGPLLARRLAQALGAEAEPISPHQGLPAHLVRRDFPEPMVAAEGIARAFEGLLVRLCRGLETEQRGARRLELIIYRVDGTCRRLGLGTSRATRDPAHLGRIFAVHLEAVDPGFGIETMTLAAPVTETLGAVQPSLSGTGAGGESGRENDLSALIDRLDSRLGPGRVWRPVPRESHLPERAFAFAPAGVVPAGTSAEAPGHRPPRPLRLLPRPEPIEATALLPDHPPVQFRWRRLGHRVVRAEGPERIEPEWWRDDPAPTLPKGPNGAPSEAPARDYFRIEDQDGRRYWLYRAGAQWFLHGIFA